MMLLVDKDDIVKYFIYNILITLISSSEEATCFISTSDAESAPSPNASLLLLIVKTVTNNTFILGNIYSYEYF